MAGPFVAAVTSEVDALILKSKAFFSNKGNFIRELLQFAITTYPQKTYSWFPRGSLQVNRYTKLQVDMDSYKRNIEITC